MKTSELLAKASDVIAALVGDVHAEFCSLPVAECPRRCAAAYELANDLQVRADEITGEPPSAELDRLEGVMPPPPRCGIQGCPKAPTPGHCYCDRHGEQLDGLEWSENGWRRPSR